MGRLHYTNYQYITNWVSTLFCMICCLFSNCSKSSSTTWLQSKYVMFTRVVSVPHSYVPVLLAMQWSIASRYVFYRGKEHLWIVFSFKWNLKKKNTQLYSLQCSGNNFWERIILQFSFTIKRVLKHFRSKSYWFMLKLRGFKIQGFFYCYQME